MKLRKLVGSACCLAGAVVLLVSCAARPRAMLGYYENHPELIERLLEVRKIYVGDIRGAEDNEQAREMKGALVKELWRKGRGYFTVTSAAAGSDAMLLADMKEELGPLEIEEPLPFDLKPKVPVDDEVFLRIKLLDPKSGLVIYKTTAEEYTDIETDSIDKAAHAVIKNLMREIDVVREIMGSQGNR